MGKKKIISVVVVVFTIILSLFVVIKFNKQEIKNIERIEVTEIKEVEGDEDVEFDEDIDQKCEDAMNTLGREFD